MNRFCRRFVAKPLDLGRNVFSTFFSGIKSCIKTCLYIQCNHNHSRTVASKRTPIKFFGTFVTKKGRKKGWKRLICGQTILMKFNFCIRFLLSVMIQGLKLTLESGNCQLKYFLDAVCMNQHQIVATFVRELGSY